MITRIKNFCIHIYIGQLALVAVLSAGWWGILYPNFSMTEETYEVSEADMPSGTEKEAKPHREDNNLIMPGCECFFNILEAGPDDLEIGSRFWETIMGKK